MNSRKSIYSLSVLFCVASVFSVPVHATSTTDPPLCPHILTFRSWFCGATTYAVNPDDGTYVMKDGHKTVEIKHVVSAQVDKATGEKYVIDSKTKEKRDIQANEIDLTFFIWLILVNILYDLFNIAGYLGVGFIMYGGYLFVLAHGEAERIEKAKKTLKNAIIGLIVVAIASSVVAFVANIITQ